MWDKMWDGKRMARRVAKLNALAVQRAKKPGLFSDGAGLYLRVSSAGTKSWVFRFTLNGRSREMGLGAVADWSLAEARKRAADARDVLKKGLDPIEDRKAQKRAKDLESARAITFDECAARYIERKRAGWKNKKHAGQWQSTLKTYASPVFGDLPVKDIDTALIRRVLDPIWNTKTETASRVRSRIELILDWATTREYRSGDNPARWRGHLENDFDKRSVVQPVKHHPALSFADIPDFLKKLRAQPGVASLGLEFLILTASRTGEVIGACWDEIDLDAGVWTIPPSRMKAKREHRVPLSPRATEILRRLQGQKGPFIFSANLGKRPLSNMAFLALLRRMECNVTAHGFRSTFRDWTAECTNFPREVAETALAHTNKDKVEAAYRRGDFFEKRRKLMDAWAAYCNQPPTKIASVTTIGARAKA